MFNNSCYIRCKALLLFAFTIAGGAIGRAEVAEHRGEVAPVAVRYDGWIPQLIGAVQKR